jgi:hypothetical protein
MEDLRDLNIKLYYELIRVHHMREYLNKLIQKI